MLKKYFRAIENLYTVEKAVDFLVFNRVSQHLVSELARLEVEMRLAITTDFAKQPRLKKALLRLIKRVYPETTAVEISGDQIVLYNDAFVDDVILAIDFMEGLRNA